MNKYKQRRNQRRRLLKLAALAPIGLTGFKAISSVNKREFASQNITILFQGDSITDAGRDRSRYYANDPGGMGGGYVRLIVSEMLASNPTNGIKCYNRGISGNKVYQLSDRWEDDCLQLKPTILSILIGVNDYWHTLSSGYQGTPEVFGEDLRALLQRTQQQIPGIKIILGEPFAVAGGSALSDDWNSGFPPYQKIVKDIHLEFNTSFVPYQEVFDQALETAPASHWCPDGVHPSMAGAFLMKEAWLTEFRKIM